MERKQFPVWTPVIFRSDSKIVSWMTDAWWRENSNSVQGGNWDQQLASFLPGPETEWRRRLTGGEDWLTGGDWDWPPTASSLYWFPGLTEHQTLNSSMYSVFLSPFIVSTLKFRICILLETSECTNCQMSNAMLFCGEGIWVAAILLTRLAPLRSNICRAEVRWVILMSNTPFVNIFTGALFFSDC